MFITFHKTYLPWLPNMAYYNYLLIKLLSNRIRVTPMFILSTKSQSHNKPSSVYNIEKIDTLKSFNLMGPITLRSEFLRLDSDSSAVVHPEL